MSRQLMIAAFAGCVIASVVLLVLQGRLVEALPELLAMAAAALAVIRWVRPDAESDMIRRAEISGYLEGIQRREENVVRIRERR